LVGLEKGFNTQHEVNMMAKANIRNPYVCLAILRKGGAHRKTNKAIRAERKREAQRLVEQALSRSHYLTE
jgi:hypothetical protein